MFSNNVKFTCKQCGAENIYTLNFDRVLAKLDEIGLAPKELDYENKNFKFKFTLQYPFVRRISSFYKAYYLKHKVTSKKDARMNDSMTNMEYVNLFISKIDMEVKATGAKRSIDMSKYKASDVEDILAKFPQDVLYTEDGVMNFIAQEYLKKINDSFDKHKCAECGTV